MHPSASSSSSAAHPPDGTQPSSKAPPPPAPAMGYPANAGPNPNSSTAYYAAAPPPAANGNGNGAAAFGVAYPYPAPPPHHHHPPPPPPHPYHHNQYHNPYHAAPPPPPPTCVRRLLALVVAAFLLLGAGTFIVWLLLRPRAPSFSLATLALSRVAYSPANSSLSAAFDASVLAANPNAKLSVGYYSLLASVSLAPSSPIAVTALPPFGQAPGNSTAIAFRLQVDGAYVGPDEAAPLKSGAAGGTMEVQVRLTAIAVFDRGGWRTRRRVMRVICEDVPVTFRGKNATEAKFDGPPRRCDVYL